MLSVRQAVEKKLFDNKKTLLIPNKPGNSFCLDDSKVIQTVFLKEEDIYTF